MVSRKMTNPCRNMKMKHFQSSNKFEENTKDMEIKRISNLPNQDLKEKIFRDCKNCQYFINKYMEGDADGYCKDLEEEVSFGKNRCKFFKQKISRGGINGNKNNNPN